MEGCRDGRVIVGDCVHVTGTEVDNHLVLSKSQDAGAAGGQVHGGGGAQAHDGGGGEVRGALWKQICQNPYI